MPNRLRLSHLVSDETGGSLAPVLIALAVGVLLLSPFLAHVSTRMLAARGAEHSGVFEFVTKPFRRLP